MKKYQKKKQIEGLSIKYLIHTPQNCEEHEKQGKFQKLTLARGACGDKKYNVIWVLGWGSGTGKERWC